jgi:hypothetical protein
MIAAVVVPSVYRHCRRTGPPLFTASPLNWRLKLKLPPYNAQTNVPGILLRIRKFDRELFCQGTTWFSSVMGTLNWIRALSISDASKWATRALEDSINARLQALPSAERNKPR